MCAFQVPMRLLCLGAHEYSSRSCADGCLINIGDAPYE